MKHIYINKLNVWNIFTYIVTTHDNIIHEDLKKKVGNHLQMPLLSIRGSRPDSLETSVDEEKYHLIYICIYTFKKSRQLLIDLWKDDLSNSFPYGFSF